MAWLGQTGSQTSQVMHSWGIFSAIRAFCHYRAPSRRNSAGTGAKNPVDAYARRIYTMAVSTWDEAKRDRNIKDHGIDFADLEGFFDGDLVTREDTRLAYGEPRFQSVGVFNGVPLF